MAEKKILSPLHVRKKYSFTILLWEKNSYTNKITRTPLKVKWSAS